MGIQHFVFFVKDVRARFDMNLPMLKEELASLKMFIKMVVALFSAEFNSLSLFFVQCLEFKHFQECFFAKQGVLLIFLSVGYK